MEGACPRRLLTSQSCRINKLLYYCGCSGGPRPKGDTGFDGSAGDRWTLRTKGTGTDPGCSQRTSLYGFQTLLSSVTRENREHWDVRALLVLRDASSPDPRYRLFSR